MDWPAGLDAGLLVGRQDAVSGVERLAFPQALLQVEDAAGLLLEGRVAREDPIRALRIECTPGYTLVPLDRYAGELAENAFAEEALLLRVEAMLALGQRTQVLRLLDSISLAEVAASQALLITRGELRAHTNRCAEAIGDISLALNEAQRPPKQALLGRAGCKQNLGDEAGARADFDRYRREYPNEPLP